jgi:dUTPase
MFLKYALLTDTSRHVGFTPRVMTVDAACADLALPYDFTLGPHEHRTEDLLIGFIIPSDWCLYIQPRSSTFTTQGLMVPTGIVDSDYTGSVHIQVYNMRDREVKLLAGMRLVQVQLLPKYKLQLEQIECMPDSNLTRANYMGSTGP